MQSDYTRMTPEEITAARHLLWVEGYREEATQPGSFSEALIYAITKADAMNRAKLFGAFPEYRRPVMTMVSRGGEFLTEKVKRDS